MLTYPIFQTIEHMLMFHAFIYLYKLLLIMFFWNQVIESFYLLFQGLYCVLIFSSFLFENSL